MQVAKKEIYASNITTTNTITTTTTTTQIVVRLQVSR